MTQQELKDKYINLAKQMRNNCYACKNCELGNVWDDNSDPHVYAMGNIGAKFLFIAEAPGADEVKQKKPLIGKSGKVFEEYILGGLGLDRMDVWITNTVLCRPPGNRKPTPNEKKACLPHFRKQLDIIKPTLVITLGATPMATMLGIDSGITHFAGGSYMSKFYNIETFVLLHPSYFLRNHKFDLLKKHVQLLNERIELIG